MTNNLNRKIDELELSIRVMSGLKTFHKIDTIGDLVKLTEGEFLRTQNFGRKSLNEIREVLRGMSLKLGMTEKEMEKYTPEKKPDFFEEFNYSNITKSREASEKTLKHILSKKQYRFEDIETDLWDQMSLIEVQLESLEDPARGYSPPSIDAQQFWDIFLESAQRHLDEDICFDSPTVKDAYRIQDIVNGKVLVERIFSKSSKHIRQFSLETSTHFIFAPAKVIA